MLKLSWYDFENVSGSRIVKSSGLWLVIVPIAAKFVSKISGDMLLNVFGKNITVVLQLPFSWKMLFFSALFFSAANLVYYFRCPEIVKKYSTFNDFHGTGRSNEQMGKYFLNIDSEKTRSELEKSSYYCVVQVENSIETYKKECGFIGSYSERSKNIVECPDSFSANNNNFWSIRDASSTLNRWSMLMCLVLYAIGAICLLWVLGESVCFVLQEMHIL